MSNILVVGNPFLDRFRAVTDEQLEELDLRKGDTAITYLQVVNDTFNKLKDIEFASEPKVGGSGSNVAKGLAILYEAKQRSDASIKLLGIIGFDQSGIELGNKIKSLGIKFLAKVSGLPNGVVNCLVTPDAQRTMQCFLGAATEFGMQHVLDEDYAHENLIHIEGYNVLYGNKKQGFTLETIIEKAKAQNPQVKVSLDLAGAYIAESNRERLLEVVKKVDLLFGNISEYIALFGSDIVGISEGNVRLTDTFYKSFREDQIVVVTKGADGCEAKNKGTYQAIHRNGEIVQKVVDTTGAGDMFDAGFLYGYMQGLSLEKCLKIGTRMASEIITVLGADMNAAQEQKVLADVKRIAREGENSSIYSEGDSHLSEELVRLKLSNG